ncbi:MAG TPA: DUF3781 domain-containing protein [Cytophagaceae bacterium]|jgi:hypothetical protein
MREDKERIIENLCYTELVYERINKKLRVKFTRQETEEFILKVLRETGSNFFERIGKNIYVTNAKSNIRITINSNTFRIITVNKIVKQKQHLLPHGS